MLREPSSFTSASLSGADATQRLEAMGVPYEIVTNALLAGRTAAAAVAMPGTPNGGPGSVGFVHTVMTFRAALMDRQWLLDDPKGVARAIHPSRRLAIVVSQGNAYTGREGHPMRLARAKGVATAALIEPQMALLPGYEPAGRVGSTLETWILVHYYDPKAREIRCELALPGKLLQTADGEFEVVEWEQRILLDAVELVPKVTVEPESTPDVEVKIRDLR